MMRMIGPRSVLYSQKETRTPTASCTSCDKGIVTVHAIELSVTNRSCVLKAKTKFFQGHEELESAIPPRSPRTEEVPSVSASLTAEFVPSVSNQRIGHHSRSRESGQAQDCHATGAFIINIDGGLFHKGSMWNEKTTDKTDFAGQTNSI